MRKMNLIKIAVVAVILTIGFAGFWFTPKSEMQTLTPIKTPKKVIEGLNEVKGYKNWTKISKDNFTMNATTSSLCASPGKMTPTKGSDIENSPHKDKYINVYVNSIGKDEMLTKKNPKFPVGTVVVKEKLTSPDSQTPELLTVMIKRKKGFNPEVGDWEFMTLNGAATEVTAKGKLESCQTCHLDYKQNDFITRTYLTDEIRQKLK
jgi:Cytochrome P460